MTSETVDSRSLFAGVDGGGSTTRVLIASADGSVFGVGSAEGCNPSQLGLGRARENLLVAVADAWRSANIAPRPLSAVFCGIAGARAFAVQTPIDPLWDNVFPGLIPAAIAWDHDLRSALAGGLSGKPGIVLIAGTGSACYARDEHGASTQVGGWGPLLDDAGSGYALGLQLVREAVRVLDGRASSTRIVQHFVEQTGLHTPSDVLQWTRSFADPRAKIAQLAGIVLQASDDGDASVAPWIDAAAHELAVMVQIAAQRLFAGSPVEAVFCGGLSQNSGYFEKVRGHLDSHAQITLRHPAMDATAGSLLLSLAKRGVPPSPELLRRLVEHSANESGMAT